MKIPKLESIRTSNKKKEKLALANFICNNNSTYKAVYFNHIFLHSGCITVEFNSNKQGQLKID